MGTLVLILMGNGVVANVLLRKSKGEGSGWIVITAGWALAVMCGVFTAIACGSPGRAPQSGGHFWSGRQHGRLQQDPAVLRRAGARRDRRGDARVAALPSALARDGRYRRASWPVSATGPAIRNFPPNLISEIIGTFVLVLVGTAIFAKSWCQTGPAPGIGPYLVGSLVWGIGLSLGGTTGYAINPARDLGPRIAHTILPIAKKGDSDWGYAIVPIAGPLIGGALAGVFIKLVF